MSSIDSKWDEKYLTWRIEKNQWLTNATECAVPTSYAGRNVGGGGVLAGSRQSCGAGHVGQQEVALYNIVVFFLFFSPFDLSLSLSLTYSDDDILIIPPGAHVEL